MVIRIRFGRGPVVTRRKGKNSRIAMLSASMLTLGSICLFTLGAWRLSEDLDLAGDFIFADGLLSHWQVWMAAAALTQYSGWSLTRYARKARAGAVVEVAREEKPESRVAANV
jgi:putative exporter of polyketide antibiotics